MTFPRIINVCGYRINRSQFGVFIVIRVLSASKLMRNGYYYVRSMTSVKICCPVIIGAIGIATRSLRKNLEAVPGKHSIDSLQKTAIFGTAHTIRKVLQCET